MRPSKLSPFMVLGCLCLTADTGPRTARTEAPPHVGASEECATPVGASPVAFVPNLGQWSHAAEFVQRKGPVAMFLQRRGWVLDLAVPARPDPTAPSEPAAGPRGTTPEATAGVAVRMSFEELGDGPAASPPLRGEGRLGGVHNYFLGNDSSCWRTDVPLFASVLYERLYSGIDLRVRHTGVHPEYDLFLASGADLADISVRVEGAEHLRIGADGSLVVRTAHGTLTQPLPHTWESRDSGERHPVACSYVLLGPDRFGFAADAWDGTTRLTIDPGLVWSSYLGGSTSDYAEDASVDANGIITVVGSTSSSKMPMTPGAYSGFVLNSDCFVTGIDTSQPPSAQFAYSTFLGGTSLDEGWAVDIDAQGVMTICGRTFSSNFPTTPGAFQGQVGLVQVRSNGFVARLDPGLSGANQLVYSTYLRGTHTDIITCLDVDVFGVITVGGWTQSRDFPTTPGAFDPANSSATDGFVSRLDPSQTGSAQLVYSTHLGPTIFGVAAVSVDASGVVTAVGGSRNISTETFPTTPGAFARTTGGGRNGFVSLLDPGQTGQAQLVYSTLLGGSGIDEISDAAAGPGTMVTVAGHTGSTDFPTTPGAYRTISGPNTDAFLSRIDPGQSGSAQLVYSTRLGHNDWDQGLAVALDPDGSALITGITRSPRFPTTPGAVAQTLAGQNDLFVSLINPSQFGGAQLVYSTLLGGQGDDRSLVVARGPQDKVVVAGRTTSTNYPTTATTWQRTYGGGSFDAFVSQLDIPQSSVVAYGQPSPGCEGPPEMSTNSSPRIGTPSFALVCVNTPPSSPGLLLLGAAPVAFPVSIGGVSILVALTGGYAIVPLVSTAGGSATVPLPIPARRGLIGQSVYVQVVWGGPSTPPWCPPTGLSATAGLQITFLR